MDIDLLLRQLRTTIRSQDLMPAIKELSDKLQALERRMGDLEKQNKTLSDEISFGPRPIG